MIYTIKKDTNNDTRFRIPDIFTGKFKKTWKVSLSPECWYPQELGYNQINKLVGVTEFWSANNKNSVMVGWDPCYLPEEEILEKYPHCKNLGAPLTDVKYFNIYYYTNDANGGHVAELSTVVADWRINDIEVVMNRYEQDKKTLPMSTIICPVQFSGDMNLRSITWEANKAYMALPKGWLREIFLWFGGTRKAPQDMLFKVG